jgi:uncharacterized RDD family membrane protein YckC
MTAAVIALGAIIWLVLLLLCLALVRAAALGDLLALHSVVTDPVDGDGDQGVVP